MVSLCWKNDDLRSDLELDKHDLVKWRTLFVSCSEIKLQSQTSLIFWRPVFDQVELFVNLPMGMIVSHVSFTFTSCVTNALQIMSALGIAWVKYTYKYLISASDNSFKVITLIVMDGSPVS